MTEVCIDHYEVIIPEYLGHPYLLTWSHLKVFRQNYPDKNYTYFLYIEDDMCITQENVFIGFGVEYY
jgi:hypothetical protein